MARRAVQIEADGGSRGNPGPAAYGAVLFDADSREVIAERSETIGVATNNVAEYRGLIAGLELYQEHAPEADLEVRMDSRLVVIDARTGELTASRDAAAGDVTQESAQVTGQRKVVADGVPDDLLAVYEKVRAQKGGVGAAALRARRCGGCSLELTASDLGTIAKAPLDEVLRCEECNRILVRTSESGI